MLENSISYENKAKGIDSNSGLDIKVYNSTSFNNGSYNVALYTSDKAAATGYEAEGVLSFRTDGKDIPEQIELQASPARRLRPHQLLLDTEAQVQPHTSSTRPGSSRFWFWSLDTSREPTRNADGSIDMHGLLLLNQIGKAFTGGNAGARGEPGASTSPKRPPSGWWATPPSPALTTATTCPGRATAKSWPTTSTPTSTTWAVSGASSKDFLTMDSYTTLRQGSDTVPAMGTVPGTEQFLLIGFGHNDEKTEEARYTNPNGDYNTPGSFANSLYVQLHPACPGRRRHPHRLHPIVRLTDANTHESYDGESGHITETWKPTATPSPAAITPRRSGICARRWTSSAST